MAFSLLLLYLQVKIHVGIDKQAEMYLANNHINIFSRSKINIRAR